MIMVRQLESMIRLSSVLARFHCEDVSSFDKNIMKVKILTRMRTKMVRQLIRNF